MITGGEAAGGASLSHQPALSPESTPDIARQTWEDASISARLCAGYLAISHLLAAQLFGVSATDPVTLVTAAVGLMLV